MKAVIIGGTGHIGTYLAPRLWKAGFEVWVVSRGQQEPYHYHDAWKSIQRLHIDRDAAEAGGVFGQQIARIKPDVVIDLISYTRDSTAQLVGALQDQIELFIHCGTVWTYGYSTSVPTVEDDPKCPWGNYGIQKKEIEDYLLAKAQSDQFPASIFHPGHIVGPGWEFINPAGNRNPNVIRRLARGHEVHLPHWGLATLHHVHAADLAALCEQMITHRAIAVGESFNAVSDRAITLRGYADVISTWFGHETNLRFLDWEAWKVGKTQEDIRLTEDHICHSPCHSIEKAKRLLNYEPRHSSLQAIFKALCWQIELGEFQDLELRVEIP